jgi:hypothetical protein
MTLAQVSARPAPSGVSPQRSGDRAERSIATGSLRLLLLTGSLQAGYWRTELNYGGVVSLEGEAPLKSALSLRPSEVWYDEFVRGADATEHGFLLAPRGGAESSPGEFRIRFSTFDFTQAPASSRSLATSADRSDWGA